MQLSRRDLTPLFLARRALEPMQGTRLDRLLAESLEKIAEAATGSGSFRWSELDAAFSVKSPGAVPADPEVFSTLLGVGGWQGAYDGVHSERGGCADGDTAPEVGVIVDVDPGVAVDVPVRVNIGAAMDIQHTDSPRRWRRRASRWRSHLRSGGGWQCKIPG